MISKGEKELVWKYCRKCGQDHGMNVGGSSSTCNICGSPMYIFTLDEKQYSVWKSEIEEFGIGHLANRLYREGIDKRDVGW